MAETFMQQLAMATLGRRRVMAADATTFGFVVDGVQVAVAAERHGARLTGVVLGTTLPDAALRDLLSRHPSRIGADADTLCLDGSGRLVLTGRVEPGDELEARVARFCNAVVHWSKAAARLNQPASAAMRLPQMIFP